MQSSCKSSQQCIIRYDCFKVAGWDGHFLLRMVAMLGIEEQFAFDIFLNDRNNQKPATDIPTS